MSDRVLSVEARTEKGKNAMNRLRKDGFIPGVLYSHGTAEMIKIQEKEFFKLFKGHISESVIFDLDYKGGKSGAGVMAFVKDFQRDPVKGSIAHLDLFRVTSDEKIHTHLPVEVIGTAKGVKMGGVMEIEGREIEVECLPKDLPEKIVVDVTNIEIGKSIHAKDLVLGDGVKLMSNPDVLIVAVHLAKTATEGEEAKAEETATVQPEAAKSE